MSLQALLSERRILVCVGSGGVGKTTTAAAIALAAARAGRRTLVMTIDPAKRLANSLGIDALDHQERRVPDDKISPAGEKVSGELYAMMLDQKRAFDEIVEQYILDPAARDRVRRNRIFQQISTTLTGSHEYAAMAKLWSVAQAGRYDLVVLDTPPTANALDFLDAPEKLVGAIDSPAIQWFAKLYLNQGFKVLGLGGAFVLKRLAKFVGSRFLDDVAQFVGENGAMLTGFRDRAREVQALLRRPDAGFILVCSPDPASVEEVLFFHSRLLSSEMPHAGFVVNRVHPRGPAAPSRADLIGMLESRPELRGYAPDDVVQVAADLDRTYRDFQALAEIDAREVARLTAAAPGKKPIEVPLFDRDVYDVEGLTLIGKYLFPPVGDILPVMRFVAFLSVLLLARAALADDQDTEIAKRHFNYGKELYGAQRYDEAIVEFEAARSVKPLPAFDYNIGLCHDRLEHLAEAIAAYRRFLDGTPDPKERIEPAARVKVLEARLAAAREKGREPPPKVAAKPSLAPAIAVGGVAVAAVLVGAVLLGTAGSDYNQLHDSCAPLCARSSWSDLPARADAGYALLAIGVAAAAVDVVLWVMARRASSRDRVRAPAARGPGFAF